MALNHAAKARIMERFQRNPADTGSAEVQIAIISARIELLTEHLKKHPKDFHSRRGLIALVNQRKKLVKFLQINNASALAAVMSEI